MPHVMSVAKFEHFFRTTTSLDIDKADIARYDDLINTESVKRFKGVARERFSSARHCQVTPSDA